MAFNLAASQIITFLQNNIPVFTVPMTLMTLVTLAVTDERRLLYRVEEMSYPEKQAYQWHTRVKVAQRVRKLSKRKNIKYYLSLLFCLG